MSGIALCLEGVTRRFRGVHALDGVSLRLHEGEIVGLIGPNGSGKTTLLNVASGVLRPSSGRVAINDATVSGKRPHVYAGLGVGRTFQQIRLFHDMTVRENVHLGAIARRQRAAEAEEVLRRLGLGESSDRLAGTLPYGEQRRVEIARALAGRPRLLLLDEPAAGMNPMEADSLLETIKRIREDWGCGVLVVDHVLRLIMRLCDRVHVLAEGKTICEGSPEEVQADTQVIAAYLGSAATAANVSREG